MPPNSDHTPPSVDPVRLAVTAAGRRLAFALDAVEAVGVPGSVVPIPGARPWLLGLTVWRGRLHSLVDAGLLFAGQRSEAGGFLVLKGLGIDAALCVDALPHRLAEGEVVDQELDLSFLSAHPALQQGAAVGGGP